MLLQTPLYEEHKALGAKLIEFAGYEMPVRYAGDKAEHPAVRQQLACSMCRTWGNFSFAGPKPTGEAGVVSSNDVSKITLCIGRHTLLTRQRGGVVDDCFYRLEDELYMMVVTPRTWPRTGRGWSSTTSTLAPELENISERTCLLALSGPNAAARFLFRLDMLHIHDT
jgi:Glycine cleavage system T protein (aminomethyltransferase)